MLVLALVLFEIIILNTSIALNGAASNPFSSVLLVPLILGLIWLPAFPGLIVLVVSVIAQGMQLLAPVSDHHGAMMQSHAQSMIVSFIATSCLITAVIHFFKYQLRLKQAAIQQMRERQLRDEQLLAIGTAAAQLTHDAATPVQTMQLLIEELEDAPDSPDLAELVTQFNILQTLLGNWREVADEVRDAKLSIIPIPVILDNTRHIVRLSRPEANVHWPAIDATIKQATIEADRTLVPALASIVINACDGAKQHEGSVNINTSIADRRWVLTVDNPHDDAMPFHNNLGSKMMTSETGLGMGAVLSNASIEKFNGSVHWQHKESHILTTIKLPLCQ